MKDPYVDGCIFNIMGWELKTALTFILRSLNPNVGADGRIYFHFKYPSLHLSATAFSRASV